MISDRNRIAPCSFSRDTKLSSLYQQPDNIIEVFLTDPREHLNGKDRFIDYAISCKTNLPHFRIRNSLVRRRYKQFCLLRDYLSREATSIFVPDLPSKSYLTDRYSSEFIQERMRGMEKFIQE
jgi:sorting nexin-3/12